MRGVVEDTLLDAIKEKEAVLKELEDINKSAERFMRCYEKGIKAIKRSKKGDDNAGWWLKRWIEEKDKQKKLMDKFNIEILNKIIDTQMTINELKQELALMELRIKK